jgi:hypothetical protein
MTAVFFDPSMIVSMAFSVASATLTLAVTLLPDWEISDPISLVEEALRSASLLTSSATTANPRPCSPARAASMEAFKARRLVWSAMSEITPTIPEILSEPSDIEVIDATTAVTDEDPSCALSIASRAVWVTEARVWETCSMVD